MKILLRTVLVTLLLISPVLAGASTGSMANQAEIAALANDGAVTNGSEEALLEEAPVSDPLEFWNRIWFTFNDLFYFGILKPISQVYGFLVPEVVRIGIANAFHNLAMPKHFVSALLQGKVKQAGVELSRFGINTVLGGLGLVDVASHFNLESANEDIGQTLGTWGLGDDLYLVWPVMGPSNFRDTLGLAGDSALNVFSYVPDDQWARVGIFAGKTINTTSMRIGEYEDLKEAAFDPYIALRDAYLQNRRHQIRD